jgi:hypothetical protein
MEMGGPTPRFITAANEIYSESDESSLLVHPSTLLLHSITFTFIVILSSQLRSPGDTGALDQQPAGVCVWGGGGVADKQLGR